MPERLSVAPGRHRLVWVDADGSERVQEIQVAAGERLPLRGDDPTP